MKLKKTAFIIALILTFNLTLAACGGGKSDKAAPSASASSEPTASAAPAASSEPTASAAAAAAPAASSKPAATENTADTKEGSESFDLTSIASQIGFSAMGVTEAGETVYFAEAKDDSFAILVFYNLESNANVAYVGPTSIESEIITITDSESGNSFGFSIEDATDGGIVIDMGENGTAILAECDAVKVLEAMQSIDDYSESLS